MQKSFVIFFILIITSGHVLLYSRNKGEVYYERVKKDYLELMRSQGKQRDMTEWDRVIEGFNTAGNAYPDGKKAPDALFMAGELSLQAFKRFKKDRYLQTAILAYTKLSRNYIKSSLADDAGIAVADIFRIYKKDNDKARYEYERVAKKFPEGDQYKKAKFWADKLNQQQVPEKKRPERISVVRIESWTGENYTRVSINLSGATEFEHSLLPEDKEAGKPKRIMVDVKSAVISTDSGEPIPVGDDLLQQVRVAQFSHDIVRVVLDLKSIEEYNVFYFEEPFRIIVDIFGESSSAPDLLGAIIEGEKKSEGDKPGPAAVQTEKPHIFIDPGHGGEDPGAVNRTLKLREKDIVLSIALKLKDILLSEGYRVSMSREKDIFIPLPERTAMANRADADLFISIHANASRRKSAYGIETYFFDLSSDRDVLRLAAMENGVSIDKLDTLQFILTDMERTPIRNQSVMLASAVQDGMYRSVDSQGVNTRDLGVKHGPFYVLKGARMPSILIETAFITNPKEGRLLASSAHQERLAKGIYKGVRKYLETLEANPLAFMP